MSGHHHRRATVAARARRDVLCQAIEPVCACTFEPLESRRLLTITLTAAPGWVEQGPGTMNNGNNIEGIPNRPASGAVTAVALDPTNADRMFAGAANGGVWRTNNATAANPHWVPLTDSFPALDVGSIEFSPLDPARNTLYVGIGRFSSGFGDGGPQTGLLKTSDGGNSWVQLGQSVFNNQRVAQVLPTSIGTPATQVVLVGTNAGVYRSADGGQTFTASPVRSGNITGLVADPSNPMRFYAAVPGVGVYLSTDGGLSFNPANGNIPFSDSSKSTYTEIAASQGVVYAVMFDPGAPNAPDINVFRSSDQGATWTQLDDSFEINGPRHQSIVADPANPNILYVAGVPAAEPSPKPFGANRPSGRVFRLDASQPAGSQWQAVIMNGANGTSPHPDSRSLEIDANGDLINSNDGGIYKLVHPNDNGTRVWSFLGGDMRTTEFYSVAYDPINNVIFGGDQDNGTPHQDSPGGFTSTDRTGADGGIVQVDADQTAHPGIVYRYGSEQSLGFFIREQFDASNNPVSTDQIKLLINGTSGNTLAGVETAGGGDGSDSALEDDDEAGVAGIQFIQAWR
jgi:hypothetical protein